MSGVPYSVQKIEPGWVLQPETMGGKQKFWYRWPCDDESLWVFKYPRPETGEHWAEKIAAEIAGCLGIPCARIEFAVFQDARGSASKSFISRDQNLFHGNQILARHMADYDPGQAFDQSQHSLKNIWLALEHLFEEPVGLRSAKSRFAEFLVLDAVIGNTDRHHENWGVARRIRESRWVGYLAESFDHASSLGRELRDTRRHGLMAWDYRSSELFPTFSNRVIAPNRPDFKDYLQAIGLTESVDPIEILAANGGHRATDTFEVFPKLLKDTDGSFACRFFLHGWRHVSQAAQNQIASLQPGDRLNVALELTNPVDTLAVQIQTTDYYMIGWAPRYLASDLTMAMAEKTGEFSASVVRVNPMPAPSSQRVLVEMRGYWKEHEPMSGDDFLPLVGES